MSLKGKWRIVEMEAWDKDSLDLVEPAYILFGETTSEFAFGCVTGSFGGAGDNNAIVFDWEGADEMDEARGGDFNSLLGRSLFRPAAAAHHAFDGRLRRRLTWVDAVGDSHSILVTDGPAPTPLVLAEEVSKCIHIKHICPPATEK